MSAEPEKYYVDKWFNYKFDKKYEGWYDKWYPKMGNFEVPHYTQYKDIEGIWQLEYTRDKLAKYGLKDPWMRNEIWRYPRWYQFAPAHDFLDLLFGRNFVSLKYGLLLTATVLISQNVYWRFRYGHKPPHRDDFFDWLAEYDHARDNPNQ